MCLNVVGGQCYIVACHIKGSLLSVFRCLERWVNIQNAGLHLYSCGQTFTYTHCDHDVMEISSFKLLV